MAQAQTVANKGNGAEPTVAKKRKPRAVLPENETPAQRFSRLGSARLTKAVTALRNLEKLAGRSYESTDEQVKKIEGHLNQCVTLVVKAFENRNKTGAGKTKEVITL